MYLATRFKSLCVDGFAQDAKRMRVKISRISFQLWLLETIKKRGGFGL